MNTQSTPPPSGKRNKTVACLQCRERKVRCSGTCPYANCTRRSTDCVFEQEDRKIVVSENLLNDLKRKAQDWDEAQKQKRNKTSADTSTNENIVGEASPQQPGLRTSADDGLPQMINPLLTPLSKFVVDHRGRKRFLGPSSTWAYSHHVMGMIREYVGHELSPEVPLNHDGVAFNIELPSKKQTDLVVNIEGLPSLDYALYLTNTVKFHIVQTYHLFDEQKFMPALHSLYNDGPLLVTAGNRMWYVQYFLIMALAMELFPDTYGLYIDPILSIEVCCGLALYLQAVDHRNSAYVYLGMGLRIALSQGLHRDIAGDSADDAEVRRYRNAWWTLYILDRKFSSLMGAPSSVQDSDISVPILGDQTTPRRSSSLEIHIMLSRLKTKVLNTIYGIDGKFDVSFPKNTMSILRELAALGVKLNSAPDLKLDNQSPLSRVSATLNLCYHQASHELFLPFDLDHAFLAGFVLALISAIQSFPDAVSESSFELTRNILDALIAGGNLPTRFRRQELERLHDMLHLIEQRDILPQLQGQENDRISVLGEQGISPNQILNVASLLDGHTSLGADLDDVNDWLWEVNGFEGLHPV
ncbi:related to positive activator of transcription [Fusarium fujikuroi IMI 58289]|uniref:Related to positive activator of transcription n=1 Tax=Gibberella fujikuroi (strain CBS 195.34 / IMI 58289 / NRRL A-6831) TaxID=1279085 RepID=S0E1L2_GIBF5|nr:related to positive activator of transcription [Fusarium fujikuroi IMI 58289]KLP13848.1 positive activator of transcription [Fusarium fujikuroi]CCT66548.1 related to positive activator of transcription [Fusarium fujikuroi IMI 58289]SCN81327.1 related to positive activator of transcription [Fusarium fujikuroi]SCO32181.1 related to positive activator of transcription [Fusarium fujikuroi]